LTHIYGIEGYLLECTPPDKGWTIPARRSNPRTWSENDPDISTLATVNYRLDLLSKLSIHRSLGVRSLEALSNCSCPIKRVWFKLKA